MMKTLAAIVLSVAMLGARAQADIAAEPFEAFDQTPGRGWRALAEDAKYQEAATLIDRFIANSPNAHGNMRILNFHAGQMYAAAGNYNVAEERFWLSLQTGYPLEFEPQAKQWNSYVMATIAFLHGDKESLQKHRDEIAKGSGYNSEKLNLKVVERLLQNLGRPYLEAYLGK
jgi:hypothetical protein